MGIGVGVGLLLVMVLGGAWCYRHEKRLWNAGHCLEDGSPWRHFDTDSQGGRGYKCEHGHCEWISWPVDRRGVNV